MTWTFIIPLRHLGRRHDCNDDVGSHRIYYALHRFLYELSSQKLGQLIY